MAANYGIVKRWRFMNFAVVVIKFPVKNSRRFRIHVPRHTWASTAKKSSGTDTLSVNIPGFRISRTGCWNDSY